MPSTRRIEPRHWPATGFTLIELMIVVVIVAVLALLAYGGYQSQVRKARRSDAIAMLSAVQQAQERWRANCPNYAASLTNPAPDSSSMCAATRGLGFASNQTDGGYYVLGLSSVGAAGYTLSATAVAGKSQTADKAGASPCNVLGVAVSNGTATPQQPACWSK